MRANAASLSGSTGGRDEFAAIVAERAVRVVFQPIVDIRTEEVVGYEALVRPPPGSSYRGPAELFAEAYRRGRVSELDWVCRAAILRQLLASSVPREIPIFVNVEPVAFGEPGPEDVIELIVKATERFQFVMEVTERAMGDDPAQLLIGVDRARSVAIGVALDDVGADAVSLALLPLISPEVIKLDLRLVQGRRTSEVACIVNAVLAEVERSGAHVLAEGVESPRHAKTALAMGATHAQGWYYGVPGPLPRHVPIPHSPLSLNLARPPTGGTPFSIATAECRPKMVPTDVLSGLSRHIEDDVVHAGLPAVLLAGFRDKENFSAGLRRRYERLAPHTVVTAVLGRGMPTAPGRGIRGAPLAPDDPLCREWSVVVLGGHVSAAIVATDSSVADPDADATSSLWSAVVTHNRELVIRMARPMLERLTSLRHTPSETLRRLTSAQTSSRFPTA